jgi:DNA helicase II / ATP-dependent DNA helicase PcrA
VDHRNETVKRYKLKQPSYAASRLDLEGVLNDQQRAVVTAGAGPLLVIAGAGSGKTHTLTYRMAYLVDRGVAPEGILLLTFTNRAARSMTSRAAALLGVGVESVWGGTFHSTANRILRQEARSLGYPSDYTIIDFEDASTLMKACLAEAGVGHLSRRFPTDKLLTRIYSFCINTGRTLEDVLVEDYPYFADLTEPIRRIFRLFGTRKLEMGLMDFDDLLLNWGRLLREHDDLRLKWSSQFEHVLVDEYQDTNHLQGEIVDLMASVHGNLMVVGDDCQSIYAFRGADYNNILEFPKRYPSCQQFKLEINYRSTPQVLDLANRSIAHNARQFQKTLRAHRPDGPMPVLMRVRDANQQALFVCQRILELLDEGIPLREIAVLYRSHHHSLELQVELTRHKIPFIVRSGLRFFEQAHIKDLLAYLRFLYNGKDELAFMRLIRQWHGIGQKRAADIWLYLSSQDDPYEALTSSSLAATLPGRAGKSWEGARRLLTTLRSQRLSKGPATLISTILESEYVEYLHNAYENSRNRLADLEQLAAYADQFETVDHFLGEITLLSTISGQEIAVGEEKADEHLCLSSIHQAKGLEWSACFVLWLSDGEFPNARAVHDDGQLEEERRLFYVATTRAKTDLYLCHPFTRSGKDRHTIVLRESEFIEELDDGAPPFERWAIDP